MDDLEILANDLVNLGKQDHPEPAARNLLEQKYGYVGVVAEHLLLCLRDQRIIALRDGAWVRPNEQERRPAMKVLTGGFLKRSAN
jgi:hypothetical protein